MRPPSRTRPLTGASPSGVRQGSGQLLFQVVLRVVIGIGQRAEVDADVDVDALAVLLWPGCSEAGVRGVQVPVEDCLRAGSILALAGDAPVLAGGPESSLAIDGSGR